MAEELAENRNDFVTVQYEIGDIILADGSMVKEVDLTISMGGNKVNRWHHIRNILIVWLLTGIWHGASFFDMRQAVGLLKSLFGVYGQGVLNRETVYLLYNNAILLVLCILGSTRLPKHIGTWISLKSLPTANKLVAVGRYRYIDNRGKLFNLMIGEENEN